MVRSQGRSLVTAQPVMTPLWAAPEVMRHQPACVKADIWSYGVLVWELATGEDITQYPPLATSKMGGDPRGTKVPTLSSRAPAVARKLFTACTAADPAKRPTAQQVVAWLKADLLAAGQRK